MNNLEPIKTLLDGIISSSKINDLGITFVNSKNNIKFVSYKEIMNNAIKFSRFLKEKGIKPQQELVFQVEDIEKFVYIFWGCLFSKIIAVPATNDNNSGSKIKLINIWKTLNNPYLITDKEKIIEDFRKLNVDNSLIDTIEAKTILLTNSDEIISSEECEMDLSNNDVCKNDIAFIQFSSGSTGNPKGVILTHENLLTNIKAIISCAEVGEKDRFLSWMPLTHDMGMIGGHLMPVIRGIDQYLMHPNTFLRHPMFWMKLISCEKITLTLCPNFGYKHFINYYKPDETEGWDLSHVRLIFNGAEPISFTLYEKFVDLMAEKGLKGNAIYPVYGMAEASLAIAFPKVEDGVIPISINRNKLLIGNEIEYNPPKGGLTFVDVGYPVDDCFFRIQDDEDNILPENRLGIIFISGKNVTRGYYNNGDETKRVFSKDGWLNTGDMGFIHNKRLVITGRAKEIIFYNGANYYPHDIENIIYDNLDMEINDYCIANTFNQELGEEEIYAFVVYRKHDAEFITIANKIKRIVLGNIGIPIKKVIPVKSIPRTTSRKIQRYKLIQMLQNGDFDKEIDEMNILEKNIRAKKDVITNMESLEEEILSFAQNIFDSPNISIYDNFIEFGGTSILLMQFLNKIDSKYPNLINISDLYSYPTIYKLVQYIKEISLSDEKIANLSQKETAEFLFGNDMVTKLNIYCKREKVKLEDLLISLYVFILYQLNGDNNILLPVVDKSDSFFTTDIDITKVEELTTLVELISKQKEQVRHDINSISRYYHNSKDSINIVFSFDGYSENIPKEILNNINLLFSIKIKEDKVLFSMEYTKKLDLKKIDYLKNIYIDTIKKLIIEE